MLDDDHFGLEKVKERIIEYLAVQPRSPKINGPILCLVGPPGVGKTSLGKSIAKATGRNFVRMSLGGVRDEAEIRGHRRTYIGSMPGKVIQSMKKAKTVQSALPARRDRQARRRLARRPVVGAARGAGPRAERDLQRPLPGGRLRPVGRDVRHHGQQLRMPQPLMDRMEIIRIPGYTEDEKVEIAKRHLMPKQIEAHGLKDGRVVDHRGGAARPDPLLHAGSRRAESRARDRQSGAQGGASEIVAKKSKKVDDHRARTSTNIAGVRKFRYGEAEAEDMVGVVTGLAWTEVGGEILTIECGHVPGKGKLQTTGKLGDVMKEIVSARRRPTCAAAGDQLRHQADAVRASATSTCTCRKARRPRTARPPASPWRPAIVSVLTGIPVRRDVAMTGEITLRGRVLPIGGLKEKLLAALRSGINTVLIPKDNEKDLADIPDNVKKGLSIIPVAMWTR